MSDTATPNLALSAPESTRTRVAELVELFRCNLDLYRGPAYNEAQIRVEFLDPFFEGLGWDIANRQGFTPQYRQVVHEDSVKVGGGTRAPDYCFRIGGQRKFYLEAKKPSVSVQGDPGPAFQLRRYGWSAKLPLCVLTNFEEFAVYDCRKQPVKTDLASVARVRLLSFTDYLDHLDELYSLLSPEAIQRGALDRWAEDARGKRGTSEVDAAFLQEIEAWRESLAKDLARHNRGLSVHELNFAVQATVDRILFLRIAEDRGVEPYGRLQQIAAGRDLYRALCVWFEEADTKYNAGLFDFKADALSLGLQVSDRALKPILGKLYYPDCPYEFSVLGADILGAVYEQFLGKVIRLTPGHQAKVEEKPEVKKAGGVYYTPRYIVDYIVEHTVGEALREAGTPEAAARLRILDPACGSGSFLLGVYQRLLDWHLDYYTSHDPARQARRRQPLLRPAGEGEWRLTISERKRILLASLFGVDLDPQAVEVTKLNLLLKCLEGETQESADVTLRLLHERLLPNLDANIKCGNSLIGPDYFEGRMLPDAEELRRVNPFDWQREFPDIMKAGGFDCVIGNPPYIQCSMAEFFDAGTNEYLRRSYTSSMARLNTFGLFIERMIRRTVRSGGLLSFIVPNTLLTQESYRPLRGQMLAHRIVSLTTFSRMVFRGAVVETAVFVLRRSPSNGNQVMVVQFDNHAMRQDTHTISQDAFARSHSNAFTVTADNELLGLQSKLQETTVRLGDLADINQAIALKHDRAASLHREAPKPNYVPVLDGRDIGRYSLTWPGVYLAYDRSKIHSCKRTDIFEKPEKILFRRVGDGLVATLDAQRHYALNTLVVINWTDPSQRMSLRYLLGLINSALLNAYYVRLLKSTKKVFSEIQARQVAELPIRTIDFTDSAEVARHDRIVALVETMLELNPRLAEARTPTERDLLQRQIAATDQQIDRLVYELYGLTEEEIKIVEEAETPA